MSEETILKFPDGFLWGASTSAHQVEGGNINDWSEWEKKNAERLAREAKDKYAKWQQEKFPEMFEPTNYISGRATDHYNKYEEDFDIAKSLGHNAHRFSIEWSRIEPEEGKFDEKEIEHYRNVIKSLRARGIEPLVTLWHWSLPVWLADRGGWELDEMPDYFEKYTKKVVTSFDDIKFWITINEPQIFSGNAYLNGIWTPEKKSIRSYFKVIKNLILSHKRSYHVIKENLQNTQVGISRDNIYFEGYGYRILNTLFQKPIDWWWNYYFLNRLSKHLNFIGLNSYFKKRFFLEKADKISDLGWGLYKKTLYETLVGLKKYKLPIYITENGLADAEDVNREWFVKQSLSEIHNAIKDGVDVRGYLYWSLLDNFEWDKGFWPRFGLVEIDYKTMERKIRPSAYEYAEVCKTNRLKL